MTAANLAAAAGGNRTAGVPGALLHLVHGTPALSVNVGGYDGLAVGPDGSVYFTNQAVVGRITPDGTTYHVPPGQNLFRDPRNIAVASDGTVLIADAGQSKVFAVGADGVNRTAAGTGANVSAQAHGAAPSGASRSVIVSYPWDVQAAPDGSVLVLDLNYESIRKAEAGFPPLKSASATLVASSDGGSAYVFEGGRHTRTVDTLTGVTLSERG